MFDPPLREADAPLPAEKWRNLHAVI